MTNHLTAALALATAIFQRLAFAVVLALAIGLTLYSLLAIIALVPFPELALALGGTPVTDAGHYALFGLTLLAITLCFYLPTNARVMALENSHRSFHMGMQDVARAYAVAHASDRAGNFTLSGEFDSVRERIDFLRRHPDLSDLEPPVLELAAQMSHVSRELAETYSEEKVARARDFLIARQREIADFNARLDTAKATASEIRGWTQQVDLDEAVARSQLDRLREDLAEVLPELGPLDARNTEDDKVMPMPRMAAE
ncbi:DNA repair protein [Allosediminivita pacifica]|uniref:DNA repair protein n=1 Tax=Allosediminivita pacifica TaxID=1267769 RepID=A0A2T6AV73_9RHOB|nr:DNA repair protein [Allosediminivita pacifica]PTX47705.1 hypothetical protein C8N44_11133 [Allosediminivita pacifica]GGB13467.1 hypothetical protein GCM10011324_24550 [Allosediminivita pacifica]